MKLSKEAIELFKSIPMSESVIVKDDTFFAAWELTHFGLIQKESLTNNNLLVSLTEHGRDIRRVGMVSYRQLCEGDKTKPGVKFAFFLLFAYAIFDIISNYIL